MVAARRLRKSMLKEMPDININSIDSISNVRRKNINSINEEMYIKDNLGTFEEDKINKRPLKLKYILKMFISILIVFSCLFRKTFF